MRRLLFVPNPHVRFDRAWAAPYVPLESLSAMAVAEERGAEAALFDVNRLVEHGSLDVGPGLWERAAAKLAEAEPDLVVFETWTGTLHNTLELARHARGALPEVPLVLAGAGTSAMAAQVLSRFAFLDGVIRGEPEPAIGVLAGGAGRALPGAPGLVRREGSRVVEAELASVSDLDALPRPAFHLALLRPGDTLPLEPGRGCGQGCSFCAISGHWSRQYRPRSVESLAAEMIDCTRRFPGSVLDLTQDPVFFTDPQRLSRLCDRLDGQGAAWTCLARADRLGPTELARLSGAGCRGILLGVETGCPEVQAQTGKCLELSRLIPTVTEAARLGLNVRANFIVGFPGEQQAALIQTVEALVAARRAGADTAVQVLRAYPGSEVHAQHAMRLEPEPLLSAAAPGDVAGLALIAGHPDLLSASYRVPVPVRREELLAAWVLLSALPGVLDALSAGGVGPARLVDGLALDPVPGSLDEAVAQVAEEVRRRGAESGLDPRAVLDLLDYHQAVFELSRLPIPDWHEPDSGVLARCLANPGEALPCPAAPWRIVELAGELERLLEGHLGPVASRGAAQRVLVAKVPASGRPSYFTRRAFVIESFALSDVGAALLPLCTGELDVECIAHTLAARRGWPPAKTVTDCARLACELARAGVLRLQTRGRP